MSDHETDNTHIERAETIDWFRNNPTYALPDYVNGWLAEETPDALKIVWDEEQGRAIVDTFPLYLPVGTRLRKYAVHLMVAESSAVGHQAFAQLSANHPSKFGLVRGKVSSAHKEVSKVPLNLESLSFKGPVDLPYEDFEDSTAWFAPDADPNQFGTLFVYLTSVPEENEYAAARDLYWSLGQVGRLGVENNTAKWNDYETIKIMFEQVLRDESETYLTLAALSGEGKTLQTQKQKQEYRASVIAARESFRRARDQVKPRIVRNVLKSVTDNMPNEWKYALYDFSSSAVLDINSLRTPDAFPSNEKLAPINAAGTLTYIIYPTATETSRPHTEEELEHFFAPLVTVLGQQVHEKNLGSIIRAYDGKRLMFLIVKNVELAAAHILALKIGNNDSVHTYEHVTQTWKPLIIQ